MEARPNGTVLIKNFKIENTTLNKKDAGEVLLKGKC